MSQQERKKALIEAAVQIIARDGLSVATARAIVAEAKMPLGAFHYTFESREDMLRAAIHMITVEEATAVENRVNQVPQGAGLRPVIQAALGAFIAQIAEDDTKERALLELALDGVRSDRKAVAEQWAIYREAAAEAIAFVGRACRVTWSAPTDVLARRLIMLTDAMTVTWLIERDAEALVEDAAVIAEIFVQLAEPEPGVSWDEAINGIYHGADPGAEPEPQD